MSEVDGFIRVSDSVDRVNLTSELIGARGECRFVDLSLFKELPAALPANFSDLLTELREY